MKVPPAKKGTPLYKDLRLMVRVLDNGQWYQPPGDLDAVWPRKLGADATQPRRNVREQRTSFARLGVDRQGRVWLSGTRFDGPGIAVELVRIRHLRRPGRLVSGDLHRHRGADARQAAGDGARSPGGTVVDWLGLRAAAGGPVRPRSAGGSLGEDRMAADAGQQQNLYVVPLAAAPAMGTPQLVPVAAPTVAAADGRAPSQTMCGGCAPTAPIRREDSPRAPRRVPSPYRTFQRWGRRRLAGGHVALRPRRGRLDWLGNGDHDAGRREYPWWLIQKTTTIFQLPDAFTPMYTYERSVSYPDGHRNPIFVQRGVRPLRRLRARLG